MADDAVFFRCDINRRQAASSTTAGTSIRSRPWASAMPIDAVYCRHDDVRCCAAASILAGASSQGIDAVVEELRHVTGTTLALNRDANVGGCNGNTTAPRGGIQVYVLGGA